MRAKGNSPILILIVLFLVGVAGVLAFAIVKKQSTGEPLDIPLVNIGKTQTPEPNTTTPQSESVKTALEFPGENATDEQKSTHSRAVAESAVETDTINLTNCIPNPAVISTKTGAKITVINNDSAEHTITFDATHEYPVPSQGQQTIEVSFPYGLGVYGYSCDSSSKPVGIFYIVE